VRERCALQIVNLLGNRLPATVVPKLHALVRKNRTIRSLCGITAKSETVTYDDVGRSARPAGVVLPVQQRLSCVALCYSMLQHVADSVAAHSRPVVADQAYRPVLRFKPAMRPQHARLCCSDRVFCGPTGLRRFALQHAVMCCNVPYCGVVTARSGAVVLWRGVSLPTSGFVAAIRHPPSAGRDRHHLELFELLAVVCAASVST
jgi:hypothetical protein